MSGERKSPRAMLAAIALVDHLPMPDRFGFLVDETGDTAILSLSFRGDRLADGQHWAALLGGRVDTYVGTDGRSYLDGGRMMWHGWSVQVYASAPPPERPAGPSLDAATRDMLAPLVDETVSGLT